MFDIKDYQAIKQRIIYAGYEDEIKWAEEIKPVTDNAVFISEFIFVLCNSGMKAQIARVIFEKIIAALPERPSTVFGHKGKTDAMDHIIENGEILFSAYLLASDKLAYLETLPWIGPITKYHLAKNLGMDVCKPDRHLVRIAAKHNTTPFELCERLSKSTGDRIGTVDLVIWRACNLGIL